MPENKDLKRLVRARMAETGENYTQALAYLQGQAELEPLPAAWRITGDRRPDYEAGLLPGVSYDGDRVAQLRLLPAVEPSGFGALVDRALHGTTDWTQASIVLDVAEQAKVLLFGALVSGAGAIDLTRLRFEEAGPDMPVTVAESWVLPDEPQALDFGAAR